KTQPLAHPRRSQPRHRQAPQSSSSLPRRRSRRRRRPPRRSPSPARKGPLRRHAIHPPLRIRRTPRRNPPNRRRPPPPRQLIGIRMDLFNFFDKWFWAIFILGTILNAAIFWNRARPRITANPTLYDGYRS